MRWSQRSSLSRTKNRLTRALDAARGEDRSLLDLTVSNPTVAGIDYDERGILSALGQPASMTYSPEPLGLWTARTALAQYLARDRPVSPDNLVLTASTSEAYGLLFKLLCDPGDRILVPQPSYPLFEMLAAFESLEVSPYALEYDGEWHVQIDSVRRSMDERVRAILTVSPNNPTGSYLKRGELTALAMTGLPILCDEVFARYPLEADRARMRVSIDTDSQLVFSLGGLSKLVGLPQLKLGWIAVHGPEDLATEALERLALISDTYLSVSTPVQVALPELLRCGEIARHSIHTRVTTNLLEMRERLGESCPVTAPKVEGGWYAVLQLPRTMNDEEWALLLLERDAVLVQPGYFYDFPEAGSLVLSLLTPPDTFEEGLMRLLARVEEET